VGADYLDKTVKDIHIPNVVTAVLASYRGFDTFGEAVVIFAAGLGVLLLLGLNGNAGRWRASPNGINLSLTQSHTAPIPDEKPDKPDETGGAPRTAISVTSKTTRKARPLKTTKGA